MPRVSRKRGSSKVLVKKTLRKVRRKSSIPRSPKTKVHTFNGTINGGTLNLPVTGAMINTWGGIYTLDCSTIPIYITMIQCFEFARLNSLKFSLLPRANMSQASTASTSVVTTLVCGVDEIPMSTTSGTASTWSASTSEDSGITEARAQACALISPDYVRGLEGSVEVETYKKITKNVVPAWYVVASQVPTTFSSGAGAGATYEARKKHWFPTNLFSSSADAQASPVFWGLMYAFGGTNTSGSTIPAYDVKIHYSISFKRIHGF